MLGRGVAGLTQRVVIGLAARLTDGSPAQGQGALAKRGATISRLKISFCKERGRGGVRWGEDLR